MLLQTLTDQWQIRPLHTFQQGVYPGDDLGWITTALPAHWQQIPALASHAGKVVYRCRFGLDGGPWTVDPEPEGEVATSPQRVSANGYRLSAIETARYWLKLNGVFYYSQAYLNGVDLGRHAGYFVPYEREITALLRDENTLLIEVDCPNEPDKNRKRMVTGVFSHWDCLDPDANPGGIWLPVEIHRSGPVRLHLARLRSEQIGPQQATLRYDLQIDAAAAGPAEVRLSFTPRTFAGPVQRFILPQTLLPGRQEIGGVVNLRDPQLWWTHDLGRPELYDVQIEIWFAAQLSDTSTLTFGVRRFELRDWVPHLNGVRFLAKGNNYPPGDMRLATMTRAQYDTDLALARDCHMNMLRVHAHVEHPAFYEAADAAGILLWQDFPLQWLYARSVLDEAREQARAMVHLLGSHPSVAVWCMHNESVAIEDTADESLWARLRTYATAFGFNWNRHVLDAQLKAIVLAEDPTRPAVRSSGEFDIPYLRKGTDGHAYFGWYQSYGTLADAEVLRKRFPGNIAFMTEFGTQSFPNLESSLRFMPPTLDDATIARLTRHHGFQAKIMDNWIPWREAGSLAEVVDLSQDYQIFINRYYIDRLRHSKYRPTGGIVPFVFLDPMPGVLWSVVDYWRVPKRSYHAMRTAFSPQYAYCIFPPQAYAVGEPIELPIFAVNDAQQPVAGARLSAELCDPAGQQIAAVTHRVDLPADCLPITVDRLRLTPDRVGRYELTIELRGVAHEVSQIYEIEVRGMVQ